MSLPNLIRMDATEAAEQFLELLQAEAATFERLVSTDSGDWIVKGFIDIFQNVYTISADTKVVSKLLELMLFPNFVKFAVKHGFKLVLSREQNHYPDMTFLSEEGHKFAVDLKSTYRIDAHSVNSMTLGAFTGYFRNRESRRTPLTPMVIMQVILSWASSTHAPISKPMNSKLIRQPICTKYLLWSKTCSSSPSPNIASPKISPAAATPKTLVLSPLCPV